MTALYLPLSISAGGGHGHVCGLGQKVEPTASA
jgi:hypothetical protein